MKDEKGRWLGWIKAGPEDLSALRDLGVRGSMVYNPRSKCFERCEIDMETAARLEREWLGFWVGSFTLSTAPQAVMDEEKQLKGDKGETRSKLFSNLRSHRVVDHVLRYVRVAASWIKSRRQRD